MTHNARTGENNRFRTSQTNKHWETISWQTEVVFVYLSVILVWETFFGGCLMHTYLSLIFLFFPLFYLSLWFIAKTSSLLTFWIIKRKSFYLSFVFLYSFFPYCLFLAKWAFFSAEKKTTKIFQNIQTILSLTHSWLEIRALNGALVLNIFLLSYFKRV